MVPFGLAKDICASCGKAPTGTSAARSLNSVYDLLVAKRTILTSVSQDPDTSHHDSRKSCAERIHDKPHLYVAYQGTVCEYDACREIKIAESRAPRRPVHEA